MDVKELCQRGNTLRATFAISKGSSTKVATTKLSTEYIINGSAIFQVKAIIGIVQAYDQFSGNYKFHNLIFIRFVKLHQDDNAYAIRFTSTELAIVNKQFISDDGIWHLINDNEKQSFTFNITVHMDTVPSANAFATLHEDTELTDFELRGEDGSVLMHRVVLAAASPVLRRMLAGTWREAAEGLVDVPGTSKVTLQNLKDYVYLHTLPDNGLEQLLLLASYYMMQDLEQKCVDKLVSSLSAENAFNLLEFSMKHNVTRLVLSILECFESGALKVNEMRDLLLRCK